MWIRSRAGAFSRFDRSARRISWSCPTACRRYRSTFVRTLCRNSTSRVFKLLDFGDWVGVEGHLFRTKTNELTIWASRLHFLAKCLPALARKVARPHRHRDSLPAALSRPDREPRLAARLRDTQPRSSRALRSFMTARGYVEVETPMMQPCRRRRAGARPSSRTTTRSTCTLYLRIAPRALSQAADGRWYGASVPRSTGTFATRGFRRSTTPSSR